MTLYRKVGWKMMKKNISIIRGDTYSFNFIVEELLDDAYFSCKKTTNKDDVNYLFQKSLGDGISLVEETEEGKVYVVRVAPEDTHDITKGNYYYDLQLEKNGDVFTPLIGRFKITDVITREV